jgi:hypothetical protein
MMTCEYAGEPLTEPRSHPWTYVLGMPDCRYYDLTTSPLSQAVRAVSARA